MSFSDALLAPGPAADRQGKMYLYAWLIGSWTLDVTETLPRPRRMPGEWHFGWVLGGRAIQDVWTAAEYFGSTLRVYDPRSDAWNIQWTDPVSQSYVQMIARKQGNDIVQLGKGADGTAYRWTFTDIGPDSFLWRGELSVDSGDTWQVHMEYRARRVGKP